MNVWIKRVGAFAGALMLSATVAAAAQADRSIGTGGVIETAGFKANKVFTTEPVAEKRIVVAQRRGKSRSRKVGKGAVAAGVVLGILGAVAASEAARSEPRYRDRGASRSQCRRYRYRCEDGSDWNCRQYERRC